MNVKKSPYSAVQKTVKTRTMKKLLTSSALMQQRKT